MGTSKQAGFTILETMLFLAITGLLIAGVLVGVSTSINIQRYRDSVTSFKSLLQSQYSDITNVQNDRDNSWRCGVNATTTQSGSAQARGQSSCVLLGRYITITDGSYTIATVNGYEKASSTSGTDISILKNDYTLGLSTINQQTDSLEWGTSIAWPSSGGGAKNPTTPRSIAILIIRSPSSGSIYTFTSDTVPPIDNVNNATLQAMLVTGLGTLGTFPSQASRTICIDSNGLVVTGNMAIYIHAYATAETSIETRSNDVTASLGSDVKC